jgi:hypothetical protein
MPCRLDAPFSENGMSLVYAYGHILSLSCTKIQSLNHVSRSFKIRVGGRIRILGGYVKFCLSYRRNKHKY